MSDLDKLVELEQETLPVTQPRVFDSKNYYEVYMKTLGDYEKLMIDYKKMEEELKQREDLIQTYIKWKDTFEHRIIPITVSKLRANMAFCKDDELIYIAFDDHDKIKWIKDEKSYEEWEKEIKTVQS